MSDETERELERQARLGDQFAQVRLRASRARHSDVDGLVKKIDAAFQLANFGLASGRLLLSKDLLWPCLEHVLRRKSPFEWRRGFRTSEGEDSIQDAHNTTPGLRYAVGLLASTTKGSIVLGVGTACARTTPRSSGCINYSLGDLNDRPPLDPSDVWNQLAPWSRARRAVYESFRYPPQLLDRVRAWADAAKPGRLCVILTPEEAQTLIDACSPPKVFGYRFVIKKGWTMELAKALPLAESYGVIMTTEGGHGVTATFSASSVFRDATMKRLPEGEFFEGNLVWQCPRYVEAVEILVDPQSGETRRVEPARRS